MSISSVSSSSQVSNISQSSTPPARVQKGNDGDKDDSAAASVSAAKPTVNTSGQKIGTNINVTA